MKYDKTAYIRAKQINPGLYGGDVTSYIGNAPIQCDMQPYSGELALRQYGVVCKAEMIMFSKPNDVLKENNQVYINDSEKYLITYVARWKKHYECLLERVS